MLPKQAVAFKFRFVIVQRLVPWKVAWPLAETLNTEETK